MRKLFFGLLVLCCLWISALPDAAAQPPDLAGKPVKGEGGAVYRVMSDGTLRHIRDWATFLALGYQPGDIVTLTDEELAAYRLGQPLTRWLWGSDGQVYFLRRGVRYPVPDAATLTLTGGTWRDVFHAPGDLLNRYPLAGEPITLTAHFVPPAPAVRAAVWKVGALWVEDDSGQVARWDGRLWSTGYTMPTGGSPSWLVSAGGAAWTANGYDGLRFYDSRTDARQHFTTFNSGLPDNTILDLVLLPDGTLWFATPGALGRHQNGAFESFPQSFPVRALAVGWDGTAWWGGAYALGSVGGEVYSAFDHPLFYDSFDVVVIDQVGLPWFVGRQRVIHFDGSAWTAIDRQSGAITPFDPTAPPEPAPQVFPDPAADYTTWLQAWPRPAADNGRCMHYLQYPAGDDFEIWEQVTRLESLGARWVLVNYTGQAQLLQMAPLFARAGITVVWRPFVRPYAPYGGWAEDVHFLRSLGIAPYIQLYNEPSLEAEWDGLPMDQEWFLSNLVPAVREVYNAGGYVGMQSIDPAWTRAMLQRLKAEGLAYTFDRLFFVPHMYGSNHPPDYDDDIYSVIGGMVEQARVFQEELGFVPPMIAGEGGWRPWEDSDDRYPAVSEGLHSDYHVAVFEWFRTGTLSNGDLLPDYLFAFCPWLLSDPTDPAAWYDSASGNRVLAIWSVSTLPPFERSFSWER